MRMQESQVEKETLTIDGEPIWFELHTMQSAYEEIVGGQTEYPWVPLGNFGNHFFDFPELRERLIEDPIEEPEYVTPELHQWAVFCAASVEFLCNKYHLICPDWVHDPQFAQLPEPWYHFPQTWNREVALPKMREETPEIFAKRNIFCGDRVWMSKREAAAALRARRREREKQPA
jgi:hypothetical protein